jgi:MFS family permease
MSETTKSSHQHPLALGCVLLGIAAIPDAMVVPVLHDLTVERFGVSEGAAHAFMAVNFIGALLVVGLLSLLNRRIPTSGLLMMAAATSCVLMAGMATVDSWWVLLGFRCLEGGADLIMLSIPFRMIASCGSTKHYGMRMGVSFSVLFLSLAFGVGIGSVIGSDDATNVLWAASLSSGILLLIVAIMWSSVDNTPTSPRPKSGGSPLIPTEWIGASFLAIDRCLSALVSVTLPILITSGFNVSLKTLTIALAGMFMVLALFSAPAGVIADQIGGIRVRIVASILCGLGLAGLGLMRWLPPVVILSPCLLLYGAGAAGLMPSAFAASVRREASTLVFSTLQAAGQGGYAVGIVAGLVLVSFLELPPEILLTGLFPIAGVLFIGANLLLATSLRHLLKNVG